MKLDRSKPYGVIYGHQSAQFEQGGILFNGLGEALGAPDMALMAMAARGERTPDEFENAKAFLIQVLRGGPVLKSTVFKEAEGNNQDWSHITQAVALMGIQIIRAPGAGRPILWKLPESVDLT